MSDNNEKIKVGDIVLHFSSVSEKLKGICPFRLDRGGCIGYIVLEIERGLAKCSNGEIYPAKDLLNVAEVIDKIVVNIEAKISQMFQEIKLLEAEKNDLAVIQKDILNPNISRECITEGHKFTQEDDLSDNGMGGVFPISFRRCERPDCNKVELL